MTALIRAWLAAALLLAGAEAAGARTLALLVGVADYNEASGIRDLLGPRNDVTVVWRALKQRGVDPTDIAVLSDGLPVAAEFPPLAGPPNHADIIAALDRLAVQAKAGDTVIFYYSGHGTYQPDRDPAAEEEPEAGGYDQVLLPADSGAFSPVGAGIRNGLVDDELGAKFTAIRAGGAVVWAIVDSCHSGTVTRGTQITRSVDPASLGVPERGDVPTSRAGNRAGTLAATPDGGLIGFYAVDATVEAIEQPFAGYDLPMVGEGSKQRMGVFTYHLHRALTKGTALTYRELAQEIVADQVSDAAGGRAPPPVFDGALDRPLLGEGRAGAPLLLRGVVSDKQISLPAGTLHGLESGARLELIAVGTKGPAIGRATVLSATAATSLAGKIAWEPGVDKIEAGTILLRVIEPTVTFRFTVAPPPPDEASAAADHTIAAAFGSGSQSEEIGIDLDRSGGGLPDLSLRIADNRLWMLRPGQPWIREAGSFYETPSFDLAGDPAALADKLKQSVWLYARATKLVRVTSAAAAVGGDEPGIVVTGTLKRDEAGAEASRSPCADVPAAPLPSRAIEPLMPIAAANCDIVEIKIANPSLYGYHVGGFYVSANGEVAPLKHSDVAKGCVRSLPAGSSESITYRTRIQTWDAEKKRPSSIGVENVVILAIPQDDSNIAPRLCSLIQPSIGEMQEARSIEDQSMKRGGRRALSRLLAGINGSAQRGGAEIDEGDEGPAMAGSLFVFDLKP